MDTLQANRFEQTAFHESGHIAVAYLFGYHCERVELVEESEGDGKAQFNYGTDLHLIAALTHASHDPGLFNELPNKVKANANNVGNKAAMILLAGSISESIYLTGSKAGGEMEVEISGPDLERVLEIHKVLAQLHFVTSSTTDFIQEHMTNLAHLLRTDNFWRPISELSAAILNASDYTLGENEIERILTNTGFLSYVQSFIS